MSWIQRSGLRSRGHGRRGQRTSRGAPGWRLSPVARTAAEAPAGGRPRTSRSSTSRTLPRAIARSFARPPRPSGDRTRERHRPVDEEDPVRPGKARHVLVEAEPVRVPGHTGDADDVSISSITARGRSMRTDGLKPPLFIVGCGRSGTTIVYELLCEHPDLAWFSNYAERWPAFHLARGPLEAQGHRRDPSLSFPVRASAGGRPRSVGSPRPARCPAPQRPADRGRRRRRTRAADGRPRRCSRQVPPGASFHQQEHPQQPTRPLPRRDLPGRPVSARDPRSARGRRVAPRRPLVARPPALVERRPDSASARSRRARSPKPWRRSTG